MTIVYQLQMLEQRPPEASIRAWRGITRAAYEEAGAHWHREILPRHFTPDAKGRYRHQERTRKYLIRKLRLASIGKVEGGGLIDNVFTGQMRRLLLGVGVVRAFPSRFSITMPGPRYVAMKPFKSNQPNKAAEIITVTPDEDREISQIVGRSVTAGLARLREPQTTS